MKTRLRPGWQERTLLRLLLCAAFILSARALYDVGRAAGLGQVLAAGIPILIDGFAVLAAKVITRLSSRLARTYPWVLLILLGLLSVYANGLHASPTTVGDLELTVRQAQLVAALPPVVLGLGFHLTQLVARADTTAYEKVQKARARAAEPKPRRARSNEDKARKVLEQAEAEGRTVSGAELGRSIGASEATGRTLLKRLRDVEAVAA